MKTTIKLLAVLALTTLFWGALSAHAQTVAQNITYQGYLTKADGTPLSTGLTPTTHKLEFRFYDESQAGNLLWSERQTVSVLNGTFSTLVGNGLEITGEPRPDLNLVFNPEAPGGNVNNPRRYLQITLADDPATARTFLPRQRIASTPFAFRAKVAELALNATQAQNAANSANAALAAIATRAADADRADFATRATLADRATNADNAAQAATATTAVSAQSALTANSARTAASATIANSVINNAIGPNQIASGYSLLNKNATGYGIGRGADRAILHVGAPADPGFQYDGKFRFVNRDTTGTWPDSAPPINRKVSIRADQIVLATEFNAFSDARIKKIRGVSASDTDLRTLMAIEITDYTRLDDPRSPHKKVIAQQVEKVFPQVVSKTSGIIGDILKMAPIQNGWVELETTLKVGDRVRLIGEKAAAEYDVLEVGDAGFRVDYKGVGSQVLVFGRSVEDFRMVDYEAISMLNVSATQQIKKELDSVKAENDELRKRLAALETLTRQLVKADKDERPGAAVKQVSLLPR